MNVRAGIAAPGGVPGLLRAPFGDILGFFLGEPAAPAEYRFARPTAAGEFSGAFAWRSAFTRRRFAQVRGR
ncbi:hypothetical protein GCM10023224_28210 [Streptomonospora halophila]|uniref:Uncharacterized protein n=1 Tax=Streptomonospora halophila TaxID=427369 RepID=A0ABP9GHS5_9ACTN